MVVAVTPGTLEAIEAAELLSSPDPVAVTIRSALIAWSALLVADRDTEAPNTDIAATRARPTMSAEAVWAVRRGLRIEFCRPSLPGSPSSRASGRPIESGRYNSASEVVREALRLLEERDQARASRLADFNDELVRRAKTKVQPAYPELAKKMQISGTVKIEVTVSSNGTVKEARVVGGHPVLATAALDAAKKWRFEPAPSESSGIIDFKFEPR